VLGVRVHVGQTAKIQNVFGHVFLVRFGHGQDTRAHMFYLFHDGIRRVFQVRRVFFVEKKVDIALHNLKAVGKEDGGMPHFHEIGSAQCAKLRACVFCRADILAFGIDGEHIVQELEKECIECIAI
jgi:hypothetical protein